MSRPSLRALSPRLLLAGLNLALLAALAAFWLYAAPPWQPPAAMAPDQATLAVQPVSRPALEPAAAQAIQERPLFIAGRHGSTAESNGDGKSGAFGEARLLGLLGSGKQTVAIVGSGNTTLRLKQGDKLDGWSLQGTEGRRAHFSRGADETRELQLEHAPQPPAPAAPASANAAAATPKPAENAAPTPQAQPSPLQQGEETPAPAASDAAARRARREARPVPQRQPQAQNQPQPDS